MSTTLWIDQRDHFAMEHQEEWTEQKEQECTLNDLERDTEVVYRVRIIRRQEDKLITDSKEAATKNLPPERRAARAERQASVMPRKDGVSSTSIKPDTPINVYTRFCLNTAKSKFSLVSLVADW